MAFTEKMIRSGTMTHSEPIMHFQRIEFEIRYCLFDGAKLIGRMDALLAMAPNARSLFELKEKEDYELLAPFLFSWAGGSQLARWILETGWGSAWGVYIVSEASTDEIRKHFRKFLIVKDDIGRKLYFRFYDPRILRTFLPTCTTDQLRDFFGPVRSFILEGEDRAQALVYSLDRGRLRKEIIDLTRTEMNMEPVTARRREDNAIV